MTGRFAALCLGLCATLPLSAGDRILSATPGDDSGKWTLEVTADDGPWLWLDGEEFEAVSESLGDGRYRVELSGVPTDARRLGVGNFEPRAVIPIGELERAAAPFNDLIVYHVMMAYFANGARANDRANMRRWVHRNYAGGDLQGVLSKVGYLDELGINAVWLSPIFQSETSHGYDVQNYYRIGDAVAVPGDPEASLALYQKLVAALGERGIRVILDVPLNHAAGSYDRRGGDPDRLRPRATRARQEAEKVWEGWNAGFKYWNFSDEDTRQFLKNAAVHWVTEGGAGGLRLDYVRGVDHAFWAEMYAAVKNAAPDAFLFGEAWKDAEGPAGNLQDIASYYAEVPGIGYQFDALIEFPLQMIMTSVFARSGDARQLERWLQMTAAAYGDHGAPIYFLDNHDMTRFADWTTDAPAERTLAALSFMASLPAPMVIYYGTETLMSGSNAQRGFTDSGRYPMPWDELDEKLIAQVSRVFRVKRDHPVLTHGARLPVTADETGLVMARRHGDTLAFVAVNIGAQARTFEFVFPAADGDFLALVGESAPEAGAAGWRWTVPALTTAIAVRKPLAP